MALQGILRSYQQVSDRGMINETSAHKHLYLCNGQMCFSPSTKCCVKCNSPGMPGIAWNATHRTPLWKILLNTLLKVVDFHSWMFIGLYLPQPSLMQGIISSSIFQSHCQWWYKPLYEVLNNWWFPMTSTLSSWQVYEARQMGLVVPGKKGTKSETNFAYIPKPVRHL